MIFRIKNSVGSGVAAAVWVCLVQALAASDRRATSDADATALPDECLDVEGRPEQLVRMVNALLRCVSMRYRARADVHKRTLEW